MGRKIWMVMRLILLFMLVSTMTISAKSYSQKVNLSVKDVSIESVLRQIREQTGSSILWGNQALRNLPAISVSLKDAGLKKALKSSLKGLPLSYTVLGNVVYLERRQPLLPEVKPEKPLEEETLQLQEVTGTVKDSATGEPLAGVTIRIKGTTTGTVTDGSGRFSLEAEDDAVLEVSFVGYSSKTILVNGRSSIDVLLSSSSTGLDQLVVVGYGTQKKVNLTGSISTIEMSQEMDNRPITSASQALSGQSSGLWVSQASGQPGNDEAQLRIRGWGTLNNSNPLVIIDGVEGSFEDVNPQSIESVSVLKDAASAAIYGSKAANGVILIKTKEGKRGQEMQIKLNTSYGIQSLGKHYDLINNSVVSMNLINQSDFNASGGSAVFPQSVISAFENGSDLYKYPNTDWNDALFRNGELQTYNLSFTGGSDHSSSYLALDYQKQEGIVPSTKSQRYGISGNFDFDVSDWFKITNRVRYSRRVSDEPYVDNTYGSLGRVFEMFNSATPFTAPYTRDGLFGAAQALDANGNQIYDNRNPLLETANGKNETFDNRAILNTSFLVNISKSLKFNTTIALRGQWTESDNHNISLLAYTDGGTGAINKNYNREGLEISRTEITALDQNLYSTLQFDKNFNEVHNLSLLGGLQLQTSISKNVFARRSDPALEGLTQVDAGTGGQVAEGNKTNLRMFSYFGRAAYNYWDKYLFEFDIRTDASSRFRKGHRWGVFPGVSLGWRLDQEGFIKELNLFSELKVRASLGELGNQNINGFWPYLNIIDQSFPLSYSSAGNILAGGAVTQLVDPNITWETTRTFDVGLDLGFWENRLLLTVDYFKKNTKDIIVQLPIPLDMGEVEPPFENIGKMLNSGFEADINFSNSDKGRNGVGYNLGLNFTFIHNEVTKFEGGNSPDQLFLIREGYSYQELYGYKVIGIFQSDQEIESYLPNRISSITAGDLKFEDVNGDGRIDFQDKQALGRTIPQFSYGFHGSLKFKGFDLSFLLQGVTGVHTYIRNNLTDVSADNRSLVKMWEKGWTPQNTNTNIPMIKSDNAWTRRESSFWVADASFLKLRNLQLGYNLPEGLIEGIGLKNLYVFANAQNFVTVTSKSYQGYDPERAKGIHGDVDGNETGAYSIPVPRILSFGLSINF